MSSLIVCSSVNADGGKGQVHREVMFTVAEMKKRLPSEKRSRSKASTVEALQYALNCVKQVQGNLNQHIRCSRTDEPMCIVFYLKSWICDSNCSPQIPWCTTCVLSSVANSEYYELLMQNGQDERRDASVCTLEELERVTSEHTLKNTVHNHTQLHLVLDTHILTSHDTYLLVHRGLWVVPL